MVAATIPSVNVGDFGLVDVSAFADEFSGWLAEFDPALWDGVAARDALERFARLRWVTDAAIAVAAGRVDATTAWGRGSDRSAAAYVARITGTTTGRADETVRAARQLEKLPKTAEAFKRGELSGEQAAAVADGASADPDSEARLLGAAANDSVGELKKKARDTKAHADRTDPRDRRHRKRAFRAFPGEDAMRAYSGLLPVGMAGEIESVWNCFTKRAFRAARKQGRHEPEQAYMADGLLAMARAAKKWHDTGQGDAPPIRPHFVFRIDIAPILRGHANPGEVCEIPGVGPVDVTTARHYLPEAILDFVIHEGIDIRTVAHAKRKAKRTQLAALLSRDYVCEVEGCDCRKFLEIDHIDPYAKSRRTSVETLGYKCPHSHDLKTNHGWTDGPLQPNGKRKQIPPKPRRPPPGGAL